MKNLFILLSVIFNFTSCHRDDDNGKAITNPESKLPAATQTGANTAGCLVNGKVFLPKGYFAFGNLSCNYINGSDFTINIRENSNNQIRTLNVISYNQNLAVGQIYILSEENNNSAFGEFIINSTPPPSPNYYSTSSIITGELKITNHDFDHAIMSGTFWLDAVNSNGEKIEVREGRFDMEY